MIAAELQDRLLRAVDDGMEAQIALLARIVDINSATMNFAGVEAVGREMVDALAGLGFAAAWHDTRATLDRAGYVLARRPGAGRKMLLIGHVDTVHPADGPFQRFTRHRDRATGPGAEDMKNGVIVLLFVLRALDAAGLLDRLDLTVMLTGDEEAPGDPRYLARAPMVEAATKQDVVLSFEPGEPGTVVTSRRGVTGWVLEVSGRPGHSGLLNQPELGAGAIYETARILDGFRQLMGREDRVTINANPIAGGSAATLDLTSGEASARGKMNVVPQTVRVRGDLRCLSGPQLERVQAAMQAIAAASLPGTEASLAFPDSMPPMATQPGNEALLALYSACSVAAGGGPVTANDPVFRGGGDISYIADRVPACLDGLGGWGGDAHADTEWLDLDTFALATRRGALLLANLALGNGPV